MRPPLQANNGTTTATRLCALTSWHRHGDALPFLVSPTLQLTCFFDASFSHGSQAPLQRGSARQAAEVVLGIQACSCKRAVCSETASEFVHVAGLGPCKVYRVFFGQQTNGSAVQAGDVVASVVVNPWAAYLWTHPSCACPR